VRFWSSKKGQPDAPYRFHAESLVGAASPGEKRYAQAEPLLLEGYQGMLARKDRMGAPDGYHLDRVREWVAQCDLDERRDAAIVWTDPG